jgi:uncharacterized protein YprB with RNaseH-like and TPR domain
MISPGERLALLDDLRRRIERLEQRAPAPGGPRLPPGALHAGAGACGLLGLDGAEAAPWGACFRARVASEATAELARASAEVAARLAGAPAAAELVAGLRIVDVETTGLAGGTGTLAFLVGVARLDGGALDVAQLLLGAPREEPALLDALLGLIDGGTLLVTFNGRSFDAPLLRTRCVLARRAPRGLAALPHLDVLPVARRLWRARAPDCRLVTLEERVLGRRRTEDVPGAMAPLAYGTFLRTGDAASLWPIVAHNREDLVGTAALLLAALRLLEDPLTWAEDAWELRAAAAHRLRHQGGAAAAPLLERALALATEPDARRSVLRDLAQLQRRAGDRDGAEATWRAYRDQFPNENRGFTEVAKILEHRRRDPRGALAVMMAAPHRAALDVQRRLDRLARRAARSPPALGRAIAGDAGR